jgi:hypothetical protein
MRKPKDGKTGLWEAGVAGSIVADIGSDESAVTPCRPARRRSLQLPLFNALGELPPSGCHLFK